MGWVSRLLCVAWLVLSASSVAAQSVAPLEADKVEAKKHYQRGVAHYGLNEYKAAVKEFQEAYRLNPDPAILYNLGLAYRLDGDLESALRVYKSFLRTVEPSQRREQVENIVTALEKQLRERPAPTSNAVKSEMPSSPASRNLLVVAAPPPRKKTPVYKKWWLWTTVGVVAAGAGVAIGLTVAGTANHTYPTITY
jgi:tetratricopeptide (TPR) repeat protein